MAYRTGLGLSYWTWLIVLDLAYRTGLGLSYWTWLIVLDLAYRTGLDYSFRLPNIVTTPGLSFHTFLCIMADNQKKKKNKLWEKSPIYKKQKLLSEVGLLKEETFNVSTSNDNIKMEVQKLTADKVSLNETMKIEVQKFNADIDTKRIQVEKFNADIVSKTEEKAALDLENEQMKQELEKFNDAFRTLKLISERKYYAQTQRQKNPTTWELIKSSKSTKYNRQKESMELLKYIHGGDEAAVFGAWDALCRFASPNQMEEFMLDYKKGKWFEKLYGKFSNIYHKSDDAMNQAIATKYKLRMSGRKYTFMCKIQKSMYDVDSQTWRKKVINYGDRNITLCEQPISHKSVEQFVKQLDIGDIHSPIGLCGAFRTVTALVTMIIDLHLKTDSLRKKLIWFNGIQNHFIMEFSDNGAPETRELTMCIGTISCWNFGTRIRSRDYHYPLHTISAKEKDEVISQLWKQHTEEMQLVEGNLFYINSEKVTIRTKCRPGVANVMLAG